jgi:prevent-host-death family protein
MISVTVNELRRDLSKFLRQVRDEGQVIEITMRGEPVAQILPTITKRRPLSPEEVAKVFEGLDELIAEISAHWPEGVSAVDAVREQRRDL